MNEIFLTVLSSIGGSAVIVGALAAWLGKVWADRLSRQHEHALALAAEQQKLVLASISDANREAMRWSSTIDLDLRGHRVGVYKALWEATSILPKWPRATGVRYQDIRELSKRLQKWYFFEGGMFLSRTSQDDGYAPLQDEIATVLNGNPDGLISDTHYDQIRERCSHLRTLLATDIQSRKEGVHP